MTLHADMNEAFRNLIATGDEAELRANMHTATCTKMPMASRHAGFTATPTAVKNGCPCSIICSTISTPASKPIRPLTLHSWPVSPTSASPSGRKRITSSPKWTSWNTTTEWNAKTIRQCTSPDCPLTFNYRIGYDCPIVNGESS